MVPSFWSEVWFYSINKWKEMTSRIANHSRLTVLGLKSAPRVGTRFLFLFLTFYRFLTFLTLLRRLEPSLGMSLNLIPIDIADYILVLIGNIHKSSLPFSLRIAVLPTTTDDKTSKRFMAYCTHDKVCLIKLSVLP